MKNAILTVGAPNSGKSTHINTTKFFIPVVVISRDHLVTFLAGTDNYDEAWKMVDQKEVDRKLIEAFDKTIENGHDLIIDMTNMSKKSRKKWMDKLKSKSYNVKALVFRTPLEILLERNKQRPGKTIPEHIIRSMFNAYEEPTIEEGFSEIIHV